MLKVCKATKSTRIKNSVVVTLNGLIAEVVTDTSPHKAYPVKTEEYNPRVGIELPWADVGVYEYNGLDYDTELSIPYEVIML